MGISSIKEKEIPQYWITSIKMDINALNLQILQVNNHILLIIFDILINLRSFFAKDYLLSIMD